ncbi:hypothetical protein DID88_000656 [Monilinia fructigena]|uniref:Uncharacterized protein n=1 Tax=Monilinia fructigena TaxID=38457 RepID=A0A395IIG4_9HELO|nr:hypothetical protein DID88_000656 [Monilinia fructigena]
MYTPTLDPFNASSYLVTNGQYASIPMVIMTIPKIHALHPQSSISVENQTLSIVSIDALSDYTTAVLGNEYVTTALVGKTNYTRGLNGLKGFNVTDVRVNLTALSGPNLSGYAYVPNPSDMTIVMGDVTMQLSTHRRRRWKCHDRKHDAGTSHMDPKTGIVELSIVGKSSIYKGEHLVYYERALASNNLSLALNVAQVIADSTAPLLGSS